VLGRTLSSLHPDPEAMPPPQAADKMAERVLLEGKRKGGVGGGALVDDTPAVFLCPITQEIMDDPVVAADGYCYDRVAIEKWLQQHRTSPMTNLPLSHVHLTPNISLKSAIREWTELHPAGGGR